MSCKKCKLKGAKFTRSEKYENFYGNFECFKNWNVFTPELQLYPWKKFNFRTINDNHTAQIMCTK